VVPLSIQVWGIRSVLKADFFGTLKRLAGMGYMGVETGLLFDKKPADIRKAMDDLGMIVPAHIADVPTKETVAGIAETVKTLGCEAVIICGSPDYYKTPDTVKAFADRLNAGVALLKAQGIKVAYHSHWWEFEMVEGRYGHNRLFELCPGILCEMDVYWTSNFGKVDVPAQITMQKKITPFLHLKDGTWVKGEPNVAVGSGKMNIPACVAAADPKVLKSVVVEFDDCATDVMTAVQQSYDYITKNGLGKGRK
jgi:sugar phosphate isomerase/epimerase